MTKYIAFLRAINVGGHTVKMDELKKMFAMPGMKNISSYIQSGNVIFETAETDKSILIKKIEAKLLKSLGYEVKTFIKTIPDIETIVKNNPFKKIPEDMGLHVSLLSGIPGKEAIDNLLPFQNDNEQFSLSGTEAYILVRKGKYGETKFSNNFLEKRLKLYATTRNWATINKMLEYKEAI